jgi:hypothetical protein
LPAEIRIDCWSGTEIIVVSDAYTTSHTTRGVYNPSKTAPAYRR